MRHLQVTFTNVYRYAELYRTGCKLRENLINILLVQADFLHNFLCVHNLHDLFMLHLVAIPLQQLWISINYFTFYQVYLYLQVISSGMNPYFMNVDVTQFSFSFSLRSLLLWLRLLRVYCVSWNKMNREK